MSGYVGYVFNILNSNFRFLKRLWEGLYIIAPLPYLALFLLGHSHTSHGSERHLEADGGSEDAHHEHHGSSDGLDSAVGISLVLGFIFMLLIDQLANAKQQRSAVVSISGADIEVQSSGEIRTRCLFDDFLKAMSTCLFDC